LLGSRRNGGKYNSDALIARFFRKLTEKFQGTNGEISQFFQDFLLLLSYPPATKRA
jgi:hypothetical protein